MNNEMWLIWKQPELRRRFKVGVLYYNENNEYVFKYVNPELDEAIENGFRYYPGFDDLGKVYESKVLFANIKTRLLNRDRSDYLELLNFYDLTKDSTDLDILKVTKGRLLTDNFEFVPAFDKRKILFEVAGTRYANIREDLLSLNDKILLEIDEDNSFDDNAIKVFLPKNNEKHFLGYVPRYYNNSLKQLLREKVRYSAMVKKMNFNTSIFDENVIVEVNIIFD